MTRKEGLLAHTLQKIDVTGALLLQPPPPRAPPTTLSSGKVLNPDRAEVDDEVRGLALPPPICSVYGVADVLQACARAVFTPADAVKRRAG